MTKRRKHPIKLKYNEVDLSEWAFDALEELTGSIDDAIRKVVSEAIRGALEDEDTGVHWGAEWTDADGRGDGWAHGDSRSKFVNPLTMYLEIALAGNTDQSPVFEFDLRESLIETIEQCARDGSYDEGLKRIAAALRTLCDEIDVAIAKGRNK